MTKYFLHLIILYLTMMIGPSSLKQLSNNVVAYNLEDNEEHVTKPQGVRDWRKRAMMSQL